MRKQLFNHRSTEYTEVHGVSMLLCELCASVVNYFHH